MADVNGNTTPSGKEVELVSADLWPSMNINDLMDQRVVLSNRLAIASQYGNPAMINQIQAGLNRLDMILKSKENINYRKSKNKKEPTGLI
jgi:hypothetical protein